MALSPTDRRRLRYGVPVTAAVVTAIAVAVPQAASGSDHPPLPARTAAQLLASVEQATIPDFTGTTVETARLGLPSLSDGEIAGVSPSGQSQIQQLVTLLTGSHTAHLAYGGPERQRVAIFLDDLSETDIVHNGTDLWTYSSQGNNVSHTKLGDGSHGTTDSVEHPPASAIPVDPTQAAVQALAKIEPSTAVSVDRTARVAGRPAYQLMLKPRDARSLVGSVRIALDAETYLPLRVQIWARSGGSRPAFEVGFTSLNLGTPSASTFAFSVPPGARVGPNAFTSPLGETGRKVRPMTAAPTSAPPPASASATATKTTTIGKDWTTVLVGTLPTTNESRPAGPDLGQMLGQFASPVPGGRLIRTALVSALLTNDGRFLIGSVDPSYLEQLASQGAGQ